MAIRSYFLAGKGSTQSNAKLKIVLLKEAIFEHGSVDPVVSLNQIHSEYVKAHGSILSETYFSDFIRAKIFGRYGNVDDYETLIGSDLYNTVVFEIYVDGRIKFRYKNGAPIPLDSPVESDKVVSFILETDNHRFHFDPFTGAETFVIESTSDDGFQPYNANRSPKQYMDLGATQLVLRRSAKSLLGFDLVGVMPPKEYTGIEPREAKLVFSLDKPFPKNTQITIQLEGLSSDVAFSNLKIGEFSQLPIVAAEKVTVSLNRGDSKLLLEGSAIQRLFAKLIAAKGTPSQRRHLQLRMSAMDDAMGAIRISTFESGNPARLEVRW
jgi:hypothetical protein